MKTKLSAKFIIAFDGRQHVIMRDAELVYEGNTIIYVGRGYEGTCDHLLDCGNAVVSPGFIDLDALGDIDHGLIHCEAGASIQNHLLWSKSYYDKGSREILSAEDEAFKSLHAYTQLVRHGITTAMPITSVFYKKWAETYEELEAAAHNAGKLGLRIYLGPSYQSAMRVVNPDGSWEVRFQEEEGKKGLERAIRFVKQFDGAYNGRIKGMLAPERIETQTRENLIDTKRAADELGCLVRLHAAQGLFEYEWIKERFGVTPLQHLEQIGFLGPGTLIPHGLYVHGYSDIKDRTPGDDIELLARTQTSVIHCPLVYARSGIALEWFGKYLERGVNLAMGTDTFPPDILMNIKVGSFMARRAARCQNLARRGTDTPDIDPLKGNTYADFFNAATLGGARALGRDDLGRLSLGAKADIIVFSLDDLDVGPIDDPLRTLVNSGSPRDIRHSVIDGETVMKDRKIKGIDEAELRGKAQAYYEKMRLGYLERSDGSVSEERLFPSSFPVR